ncbi:MAG TPA: iron-sulfur cluster insertion protein ErpA, partial [Candidatus Tenderia electrophaga]|nr:iron-sulfur cluster insertion protein ErpA [Candidatus Tenderia electrophaga]
MTNATENLENDSPVTFFDSAVNKVRELIDEEGNDALKLRIYITGGGCSGFQYG